MGCRQTPASPAKAIVALSAPGQAEHKFSVLPQHRTFGSTPTHGKSFRAGIGPAIKRRGGQSRSSMARHAQDCHSPRRQSIEGAANISQPQPLSERPYTQTRPFTGPQRSSAKLARAKQDSLYFPLVNRIFTLRLLLCNMSQGWWGPQGPVSRS